MEKLLCSDCNKEFQSPESLEQHKQAKHTAQPKEAPRKKGSKKKIILAVVVLLLIAGGYFVFANKGGGEKPVIGGGDGSVPADYFDEKAFARQIPKSAIHWHPHVTIVIKGNDVTIPANVGISTQGHAPVHTHDTSNILHWEVDSPTVKNMQLGYFFNTVWKKKFSRECILDYCNGSEGTVKMFVNGIENTEFDHYMPKDKDEIKIVFE